MGRQKSKMPIGRGKRQFIQLYTDMLKHQNFRGLSCRAVKLLLDVCSFYSGFNNGNLAVTLKVMKPCGWTSNDQLRKALSELLYYGFLIKARQGGRNHCSLFALGWQPIDHCGGKHELAETNKGADRWKLTKEPFDVKKSLGRSAVFGKASLRTVGETPSD